MSKEELQKKLQDIMNDYNQTIHKRIVSAVLEYVESNPTRSNYYNTLWDTDYSLDSLAFDRAWIEDRINDGVTSYKPRRRSIKVARALGYNAYGR